MEIRTRFAPSPTGFMHVGNLRTCLYGYLFAKKNNGKFILRIEDTDQERYVEGAVEIIYNTLKKAGIEHDEGPDKDGGVGPYIQSERKSLYLEYAKKLVELGGAYYCFCDKERLDSLAGENGIKKYDKHCLNLSKEEVQAKLNSGVPYVIRQNIPTEGVSSYVDMVFGEISVPNCDMEDGVLIKSDGMPTYNFANLCVASLIIGGKCIYCGRSQPNASYIRLYFGVLDKYSIPRITCEIFIKWSSTTFAKL